MRQLYVELNGGRDNRRATEYEMVQSNALRKELKSIEEQLKILNKRRDALRKTCDHKVFYDEDGFMYDCRICNGCGTGLGFI